MGIRINHDRLKCPAADGVHAYSARVSDSLCRRTDPAGAMIVACRPVACAMVVTRLSPSRAWRQISGWQSSPCTTDLMLALISGSRQIYSRQPAFVVTHFDARTFG